MTANAGEPFLLQFTLANKTDYSIHIDNAQLHLVSINTQNNIIIN